MMMVHVSRWMIVMPDVRASPPFLKSPYGVGTWKVDTMGKAFRFIRLRSTGVNGRYTRLSYMKSFLYLQSLYPRWSKEQAVFPVLWR